jgi:hypothetical protein
MMGSLPFHSADLHSVFEPPRPYHPCKLARNRYCKRPQRSGCQGSTIFLCVSGSTEEMNLFSLLSKIRKELNFMVTFYLAPGGLRSPPTGPEFRFFLKDLQFCFVSSCLKQILIMYPRLAWTQGSSCLHLPNAVITSVTHHTWLMSCNFKRNND